ncbi:AI-2E family transporter [Micrococcus sp. EYE_162]|uniref:AI-2E family transporter n=1 Tax=unclassified Micrococcus TaxID=2620948 RepID=UPI00200304C2|nr:MULTISPECIES: AI-2E family transporter [unclassified Micrococcus]MCK6094708.1 AI-2E family transporter [Micrococcus sp. EYE_212]MCK6171240.1 AI-2E family transporter [Micrococcus sp. EYE_162]
MSSTLSAQTKINKDVPYGLTVAAAWSWRIVAIIVGLAVVWHLASFVSLIIIPLLVAALLATLLAPVYEALRKGGVTKVLASLLCVLLLILVVVGLAALAGQQVVQGFADLSERLGQAVDGAVAWLGTMGVNTQISSESLDSMWQTIRDHSGAVMDSALSFGTTAANIGTGVFIALFTLIFFLYDGDRIWRFLLLFVPKAHRHTADRAGRSGWRSLGSYVRVQILVAFIDAVGIGLGALLLGVPLPIPLAVLVFLASFIPMVGAVVSGGLAVLLALMANGPVNALLMLGVVILVQQLESNVLQPLVMGKAVALHPLAVFLAVATGSTVMGLVGAVFSVPLLAFVNSFIRGLSVEEPESLTSRSDAHLDPAASVDAAGSHRHVPDDHQDPALASQEEAATHTDRA